MSLDDDILNLLEKLGGTSRGFISMMLEVPRTTIYDHLHFLEKKQKVEKFKVNNRRAGAPIVLWRLVQQTSEQEQIDGKHDDNIKLYNLEGGNR